MDDEEEAFAAFIDDQDVSDAVDSIADMIAVDESFDTSQN